MYIYVYLFCVCVIFFFFVLQVETCQEKIISLELEDPKSLESPTTPTTEQFIQTQLQQRLSASASEDSDENQSFVTVCPNYGDETRVILHATDPEDYMNANVFVKQNVGVIEGRTSSNLQTIVEVVNPMLCGDGIATEITIGRSDDSTFASFEADNEAEDNNDDDDVDEDDGVVVLRKKSGFELSINDKMKNVLKELKQNEKVRLSLSRSMDGEDNDDDDVDVEEDDDDDDDESKDESEEASEGHYNAASVSYEEKTGANGTVFLVRERLINDFYDHEDKSNGDSNVKQTITQTFYDEHSDLVDNCQVFTNPIVEDFLQQEIRHSEQPENPASNESTKSRKESMKLELNQQDKENDDGAADEDDDNNDETPTTPTKPLDTTTTAAGNKRKKRKSKNKKK